MRREFEKKLKAYLENRNSNEFARYITHPGIIIQDSLLPREHILYQESEIIADALDSVTNGMYDPGVLMKLELIKEDSPFSSWKYGILAINCFYSGKREQMMDAINEISDDTPVHNIKNFLTQNLKGSYSEASFENLASLLYPGNRDIQLLVESIEEALENSFEDVLTDSTELLMKELKNSNRELAEETLIKIYEEAHEREIPVEGLIHRLGPVLGKGESFRMAAVSYVFYKPVLSLEYWVKSLKEVFKKADREDIEQYLIIIREITETLIKKTPDLQITSLREDVEALFNLEGLSPALMKKSTLESLLVLTDPKSPPTESHKTTSLPGQMELFTL